nr:MAG TPA: protein of unknown function (DUF5363) [Caudoviricetes sp.]
MKLGGGGIGRRADGRDRTKIKNSWLKSYGFDSLQCEQCAVYVRFKSSPTYSVKLCCLLAGGLCFG